MKVRAKFVFDNAAFRPLVDEGVIPFALDRGGRNDRFGRTGVLAIDPRDSLSKPCKLLFGVEHAEKVVRLFFATDQYGRSGRHY